MNRILGALRSRPVRIGFLLLAFGLGIWALVAWWDDFSAALSGVAPPAVAVAVALSVLHVFLMMCSWRTILAGLGSPLRLRDAGPMFWVGQLGKYIPGGVWNFLASAELGADRQIPRRTSVAAMVIMTMSSVLTALAMGCVAFLYAPGPLLRSAGLVVWCIVPLVVCLFPPILNRLIALVFRIARLPEPPQRLSGGTLAAAVGLAFLGWTAAGLQLWVLAGELGLALTGQTAVMAVSVSALAWAAGMLVLPAPAGAGIREGVMYAALAGGGLSHGTVLALVLLSRVMIVIADLLLAVIGLIVMRSAKRPGQGRPSPA